MKKRLGPTDRIYPMPTPLVVAGTLDDPRCLAVAWIGIASATPPSVAMAIRDSRHTLEAMLENGEFTVNIPSTAHAAQVDFCGLVSGRDHNKLAEAGLSVEPSAIVSAPIITEFAYALECRVSQVIEIGSYRLVVGEVLESHADESVLNDDGTAVDIEALDPLVYIAGAREYRGLGDKVADAFKIGRELEMND